jgi:hypothetical protein
MQIVPKSYANIKQLVLHSVGHESVNKISSIRALLLCCFLAFSSIFYILTPRRYPYFGVVAGLVWSDDPESYAGGSVCYW